MDPMEEIKENELGKFHFSQQNANKITFVVYTDFGYGIVVTPPSKISSSNFVLVQKPIRTQSPALDPSTGAEEKKQDVNTSEKPEEKIEMKEEVSDKSVSNANDWSPSLMKVQLRWGGTVSLLVILILQLELS